MAREVLEGEKPEDEEERMTQHEAVTLIHDQRKRDLRNSLTPTQVVAYVDNCSKTSNQILNVRPHSPLTRITDREFAVFVSAWMPSSLTSKTVGSVEDITATITINDARTSPGTELLVTRK